MKKLSTALLAQIVSTKRKELNLTQRELAEKTGINRAQLSRLEQEDYYPLIPQLEALGEVLGFEDFVNAYKEQDAGAFVVETQKDNKPTPQFVSKSNKPEDNNSNNNGEQNKEKPLIW